MSGDNDNVDMDDDDNDDYWNFSFTSQLSFDDQVCSFMIGLGL